MHPPSCRVSVQGPTRRIDVVVPSGTPVADLLPGVVALGTGGGSAPDEVRPWRLSRPVGPDLDPGRTLQESGVSDGDLLLLRHESAPALGVLRSDPVVALAGAVDAVPGRWTPERRAVLALALLAALLVGLVVVAASATGPPVTGAVCTGAVAVLLLSAGASVAEPRTADGLCLLALLPGAAVGAAVGEAAGARGPATLALVGAGAAATALLALAVAPARDVALPLAAVAGFAAVVGALGATGLGAAKAAALGLVVVVGLLPFLPRLALRAAGLVRTGQGAGTSRVDPMPFAAARAARTSVGSAVAGLVPVVAVLAAAVAGRGGVSGRWLAVAAGAALLLRARAALFAPEVVPLALAGTVAVACGVAAYDLAALAGGSAVPAVLAPAALCVGALLLALPATRAVIAAPGTDRRLRQLEAVSLLALVPLALAVLGLFGVVADAASGLR